MNTPADEALKAEIAETERAVRRLRHELDVWPAAKRGTEAHTEKQRTLNRGLAQLDRLNATASRRVARPAYAKPGAYR